MTEIPSFCQHAKIGMEIFKTLSILLLPAIELIPFKRFVCLPYSEFVKSLYNFRRGAMFLWCCELETVRMASSPNEFSSIAI